MTSWAQFIAENGGEMTDQEAEALELRGMADEFEEETSPRRQPRRFFAIENPYGLTYLNQGQRPNRLHAFPTVVARDCFVAADPEHRATIASSAGIVRRLVRSGGENWEMVGPEDTNNTHRAIPYLDR